MMNIFEFIHRVLNPHCEHCEEKERIEREDKREKLVCSSCETLREQLRISNHEKELLLDRLLEKPKEIVSSGPVEISLPKMTSWKVRQQMLEAEDRKKAQIMRSVPTPSPSIEELENELGIETREKKDALG